MQWATTILGGLSLALVLYGFTRSVPEFQMMTGRLLPEHTQNRTKWVTLDANRLASGATLPASTNVIIHIPEDVVRITRRTFFGRKGDTVRYWGYCFPGNLEEAFSNTRRGFPGKLFLSEAEREARREVIERQRRRTFSVFENLTEEDLNESQQGAQSYIRHEIDVFTGGTTCYVMSEKAMQVGIDLDDDGLNASLERAYNTDPLNPDTDGDGVTDGLEVFRAFTHPDKRDSDGDKIIDGIEDANRNGRFDPGETNPKEWDTDRDGLCDGLCTVNKGLDLRGEDKNLNGIYEPDQGEYDPRTPDSDNDGILDEHEVYLCVINGGDNC